MVELDMEKFRRSFLDEATELLEQVNEDILKAESDSDPELVNSMFRSIHTIKGSAAGFGFDHISEFSHHLETLLDSLRNGELQLTSELVDTILKAVDGLFEMVDASKEGKEHGVDTETLIKELAVMKGEAVPEEPSSTDTPTEAEQSSERYIPNDEKREELRSKFNGEGKVYRVELKFTSEMLENGYDPLPFLQNIKNSSSVYLSSCDISRVPKIDEVNPFEIYLEPEIYLISELSAEDLADFAFDPEAVDVYEVSLSAPPADMPVEKTPPEPAMEEKHLEDEPYAVDQDEEVITLEGVDTAMLSELRSGVEDYFESIESLILRLEKGDGEIGSGIDDLFRVFHTIKGDCGYVGLTFMEKYSHLLESILDDIRSGKVLFDKKAADLILTVITDINEFLKKLESEGQAPVPKTYKMLQELNTNIDEMKDSVTVLNDEVKIFLTQVDQFMEIMNMAASGDTVDKKQLLRGAAGLKNASRFVGFTEINETATRLETAIKNGDSHGDILNDIHESIETLKSPPKKLGELLVESGKISEDDIKYALSKQKKIGDILVEEGRLEKEDLDNALKRQEVMKAVSDTVKDKIPEKAQPQTQGVESVPQLMKVDQEKIDKFTNTIGELVVAKNANEYLIHNLAKEYGLPTNLVKDLKDTANLISRIAQDLQRDILSLRMVPIKQIFHKFPRIVRDISRKQDKQIDLKIIGEDTEIDKKVADLLSDPLVHLVRNSCDHGVENVEERKSAGKTPMGTVILKAYQEGSFVYIEVIDDGKGINTAKVLEKAISRGLVSESDQLDDKEIKQLILEPGFSTAEKVTDVSGRGVGMDVVKTSVLDLGGMVDIQSNLGDGTRIILKIPVTIGVSTALLVELRDETYAIPIENVAETIKLERERVKDLHYGMAIHYRGMVLPVYTMSELLDNDPDELKEEVSIVITNTEKGKVGIVVDELVNRIDIAIKPVPEYFSHLSYVGGITILGDGQAVLVLNTNRLI
ncbi:chemotaxis protein CheA [Limisalsivibrio acetivorans]|uniref:chemotaxis protein CheA n=1 Tax=Limisalsivibrio acetivorans TaxID=1304888 RepID=UPI0003B74C49|nr:chemotaxis protein CheA [Limisalsivibrio acetivorans]